MQVFAIGDIHGHAETLEGLLDKMALSSGDRLFFLGDMINKGPDTMRVLDIVLELKKHYDVTCLRGNHEHDFLKKIKKGKVMKTFVGRRYKKHGNPKTDEKPTAAPPRFKNLIEHTVLYAQWEDFILVHGGLNFNLKDPFSDKKFLMNGCKWYKNIDYDWLGQRYILHGHRPRKYKKIKKLLKKLDKKHYLNLDCGISDKKSEGYGRIMAFEMTGRTLISKKRV